MTTGTYLDKILPQTREDLNDRMSAQPLKEVKARVRDAGTRATTLRRLRRIACTSSQRLSGHRRPRAILRRTSTPRSLREFTSIAARPRFQC